MAWQILNPHTQLKVFRDARVFKVEACVVEGVRHRVCLAAPLPLTDEAREPSERFLIEAEGLAYFTRADLPR